MPQDVELKTGKTPIFQYETSELDTFEAQFLHASGILKGTFTHLDPGEKATLAVEILSEEALHTSEIEGEFLNQDSIQSSIRRFFGLSTDPRRVSPAEYGISEMVTHLHRTFQDPLSHEMLFEWHAMLTNGRRDLQSIGAYRTHVEPMQIISGRIYEPTVHYEAPPSARIPDEMDQFVTWWNRTAPMGAAPLPALTRAGIAHLYFECIHPFEDGNGRIGRTLAEKTLAHSMGHPALLSLSLQIQKNKKAYYTMLASNSQTLDITSWLVYFAEVVCNAQRYTQAMMVFWVQKSQFYRAAQGKLNERQEKAIARIFREGVDGFQGGLSAENYMRITGTSRATATRDLHDLVEKSLLLRTGEFKGTRYCVNLSGTPGDTHQR